MPGGVSLTAVEGTSFDLERGEILGIVGESGSGKTTLCLALVGSLLPPGRISGGSILFDGTPMVGLGQRELTEMRAKKVGFIAQEAQGVLNPVRTVKSQMRETAKGGSRAAKDSEALQSLRELTVPTPERILRSYQHQLSGGLRQRVIASIARLGGPALIIADEPTTALDLMNQAQLLLQLRLVSKESGTAVIVVSHDIGVIAAICDTAAVMYGGKLVESGPVTRLFDSPAHPYTKALLRCVPSIGARPSRLPTVPGEPAAAEDQLKGCPFAPRCPDVLDVCHEQFPPPTVGAEGTAYCWCLGGTEDEAVVPLLERERSR